MTPWSLGYRSVVHGRGRYLAYLGSAAFAVTVFFLYTALALHPSLQDGYSAAKFVRLSTSASAVVIAAFTFLFLLYSSAAFLRFRSKELGLLELMGVTRFQLVQIVLCENVVVAAIALAAGLGAGLFFLKLFFLAASAVLRLPEALPSYAGAPVFGRTVAVFSLFFLAASSISLRGVLKESTAGLLRARRKPGARPSYSRLRALAGLSLIGAGYAWASSGSPNAVIAGVVPVTALVSAGTFLAMREGWIAALNRARRWDRLYLRPRPFLLLSRLAFKAQENYRMLSAVSLVVAVVISAMGAVYAVYTVAGEGEELADWMGLLLFNGVFVSLVFLAAACSLLYFRLFTEIDEDRRYFRRLAEMGLSRDALRRIAAAQNGVLFLVPFLVGLVHATFAMKALDTLLTSVSAPWWTAAIATGWRVGAAYFTVYAAFFGMTHALYCRSVGEDLSKSD